MTAYETEIVASEPRTSDQLLLDASLSRLGAETCRLRGDKKGARAHEERAAWAAYVASVKGKVML